jgi:hypothetical protein
MFQKLRAGQPGRKGRSNMALYKHQNIQIKPRVVVTVERTVLTHLLPAQENWSAHSTEPTYTDFARKSYGHDVSYALPLSESMALIRITGPDKFNHLGEGLEIGKRRTALEWVAELCPEFSGFEIVEAERLPVTKAEAEARR